MTCLALVVAYIVYMASAGGDPPTAFPAWRFVRNAPYDRLDRAVFLRRDFWEAHPRRDALDCGPVAETALAAFASR